MERCRTSHEIKVVIPALNAESSIEELLRGVCRYVNVEQVIVVDDGSRDQTFRIARSVGATTLKHEVNLGKGAALQHGMLEAFKDQQVRACVMMDADGQHEPHFIPDFIKTMHNTHGDLIIGVRSLHPRAMPWARVLSNRITSALIRAKVGQAILDSQCGYRLITREAFALLELGCRGFEVESEMLLKAGRNGLKLAWVPISTIYGSEKSHIKGFRDTWRFIKIWLRA